MLPLPACKNRSNLQLDRISFKFIHGDGPCRTRTLSISSTPRARPPLLLRMAERAGREAQCSSGHRGDGDGEAMGGLVRPWSCRNCHLCSCKDDCFLEGKNCAGGLATTRNDQPT